MLDEALVDTLMVTCALNFNILIVIVFLARAADRENLETRTGYAVTLLLVPFTACWILNLSWNRELGLLITGAPIIAFLAYDLCYRSIAREKSRHHPEGRWPTGL